ncbi:hypothetical protein LTR28_002887, partial [Elasticomyces elasticus]
ILQQLDLDEHFLKPIVVVTDGHPFARKVTERDSIEDMLDQKHNAFSAASKYAFFDEETTEPEVPELPDLGPGCTSLLTGDGGREDEGEPGVLW